MFNLEELDMQIVASWIDLCIYPSVVSILKLRSIGLLMCQQS